MPAITFSDFSGGLDRRLPINVQEANRLWELKEAYITLGKRIKKRPGLRLVSDQLTGSVGLKAVNGVLSVFTAVGAGFGPPTGVQVIELSLYNPFGIPTAYLADVLYADIFQGFPYVIALYYTRYTGAFGIEHVGFRTRHNYVDGSPSTLITDSNCPHTESACKAASRIFAIGDEVVRYSKAGDPRDWSAVSDAGFLPTGVQQDTHVSCTAVGAFSNSLVVYFPEGAQIWTVAVDPSTNALSKRIEGVGSTQPHSLSGFANDLMFLSPYGFRSMTVQASVDRIDDTDVGVAVDALVVPDSVVAPVGSVFGAWVHQFGQYWAVFNMGAFSKAWVYTYSKSSKVACWSEYTFPILITAITTNAGKVYVRTVDSLYELAADQYTDDGTMIDVEVQMAFQNAKTPGVEKQIYGADFVFDGTADVSFLYDPRDQTKESISQAITGDTAPGQLTPVEIVATSVAPVIRHSADEAFEFTQLSLYFNPLTVT